MKYLYKKNIFCGIVIIFCLISIFEYMSARVHSNRIDRVLFYDQSLESEYGKYEGIKSKNGRALLMILVHIGCIISFIYMAIKGMARYG